ncbi:(R)-mandelonitrile beta-glucosyltransferase-like [Cryptomeria japonica]|uniref:(R)-mandelonitrile beta-glucosyltransferase-like n=1 Tax=Cryptomeria japonica TaxID=3369 RepID=UPI0025AC9FC5|nr:(R)-mandelonitrile beta-glucosyltransferase-like [Cryptomeria japonica]
MSNSISNQKSWEKSRALDMLQYPLFPNLWKGKGCINAEDERCLGWLDAQQVGSVIYVSFGSTSLKSNQQLEEIALGLESSQQPFLWILRMDIAQGKLAVLPHGFLERIGDRGMILGWAP